MTNALLELPLTSWTAEVPADTRRAAIDALESGKVVVLRHLPFTLDESERRFLSPEWLDGSRKNISLEGGSVRGATGDADALAGLASMIGRFADQSSALIRGLFPAYQPHLRVARTSFRPGSVEQPKSWRKDDTRLHVDAFPSRPNYGERILRVFSNVNPDGQARVWRVG